MKLKWLSALAAVLGMLSLSGISAAQVGLEELLFTEIPAVLTKTNKVKVPASVTTITADQIKMAPVRNIYDLIETYVPGAFWMNHHESPHFGIRGIISDRNYKFLLLLNGRRINQDAHSGGELLLENWDLADIERIEIIRGPGSVTYGPGAVEGVVNIVTKAAASAPGLRAGVQYVHPYDSKGLNVSYGWTGEKLKIFAYGSAVRTSGIIPEEYFVDNSNNAGYMGKDAALAGDRPLYYFDDTFGLPQLKFDLKMEWMEEWQLLANYASSGSSRHASTAQTLFPDGSYADLKVNRDQGALVLVRNQHKFTPELELKSSLSFSSLDHERHQYSVSGGGSRDLNSIRNINHKFSESELLASAIGNYAFAKPFQVAAGLEYAKKWFGPSWNGNQSNFRMGDSSNIYGSQEGATEAGAASPYFLANGGWSAYTGSLLAEANLEFDPRLGFIASARLDKHEFVKRGYFSPRLGLISDFDRAGLFKLVWQRSVRMNTEEQLFLSNLTGAEPKEERLEGYEFMYSVRPLEKLTLNASAYHNTVDIVGWKTVSLTSSLFSFGESTLLGTLRLWGVELEQKYSDGPLTLGANQSYSKQIDFSLAAGETGSGISYSDYDLTASGSHLQGTGNDLNNWPNWGVKLFADYKLAPAHTVHVDVRALWGFYGAEDGLTMLENAAAGTPSEAAVDRSLEAIRGSGAFKPDIRLNASYRFEFLERWALTVSGMNLVNFTGNKRYTYDAGLVRNYPYRTNWVNEPLSVAAKIDYRF